MPQGSRRALSMVGTRDELDPNTACLQISEKVNKTGHIWLVYWFEPLADVCTQTSTRTFCGDSITATKITDPCWLLFVNNPESRDPVWKHHGPNIAICDSNVGWRSSVRACQWINIVVQQIIIIDLDLHSWVTWLTVVTSEEIVFYFSQACFYLLYFFLWMCNKSYYIPCTHSPCGVGYLEAMLL